MQLYLAVSTCCDKTGFLGRASLQKTESANSLAPQTFITATYSNNVNHHISLFPASLRLQSYEIAALPKLKSKRWASNGLALSLVCTKTSEVSLVNNKVQLKPQLHKLGCHNGEEVGVFTNEQ